MKRSTIIILAVVGGLLLVGLGLLGWVTGTYNSLVGLDEGVKGAWSQVENVYQRRLDLIPNLVETVKGYAAHEEGVFAQVAEARASVGKAESNFQAERFRGVVQRGDALRALDRGNRDARRVSLLGQMALDPVGRETLEPERKVPPR